MESLARKFIHVVMTSIYWPLVNLKLDVTFFFYSCLNRNIVMRAEFTGEFLSLSVIEAGQ